MPDDKTKRRPQDASRINVNEPYEVTWWCDELGCTAAQLRSAVAAVGVGADRVRAHLRGR
jgi:hypothetical protein